MGQEDSLTVADGPIGDDGGPAPLFIARITQGPDTGKSLLLDWSKRPSYLLGQGPLCDLRVSDRRVSRRHLSITPDGARLRLTDERSSNGTMVNGVRVVEALLAGGELVTIGDTQLRIARAPMAAPPAGPATARRSFGRVLGASFEMQRLFELADKLSASTLPVIIEGETGTGKELLAEAMHESGPRAAGPYVVVDCTAALEEVESALFGRDHGGAFEQASGGTLVLSELSELDASVQARLVSVVDKGIVQRVGASEPRRVDVRLITTSRRDTDHEVQEGRLREDLMFRLAGARIEMPPLRRRHGDVAVLAAHFWKLYGGNGDLPSAVAIKLSRRAWPGNVRELQNAVARAITLGPDAADAHGSKLGAPTPPGAPRTDIVEQALAMDLALPAARQVVVRELERRYVAQALARSDGNVTRAAATSGLTRRYFHLLLAELKTPRG